MQEMRRALLSGGPSQGDQWDQTHRLQFLTAPPVLEEKSSPLPHLLPGRMDRRKKIPNRKRLFRAVAPM